MTLHGNICHLNNKKVLDYDVVWENLLQGMGKHMTNHDESRV